MSNLVMMIKQKIIKNVNLEINPRQIVGITERAGVGKVVLQNF